MQKEYQLQTVQETYILNGSFKLIWINSTSVNYI